jgi:hypothetical protein
MTWIQTRGGDAFELLSPKPGMIHFEEIATILSRIPRFNGHTGDVFSVAQHCTEGAKAILRSGVEDATALAFLLHDAHEAFLGDLTSPVLVALDTLAYDRGLSAITASSLMGELKRRADAAIYAAAGLKWPLHPDIQQIVAYYDLRMLRTERDALMAPPPKSWTTSAEAAEPLIGCKFGYVPPRVAAAEWLELFQALSTNVDSQHGRCEK